MNTPRHTKWLKTAKISLVAILCILCATIPTFAVYTNGTNTTERYYTPLKFDMSIGGTVAEFLPSVTYTGNNNPSVTSVETSGNQTITRSAFSFASNGSNVLDVSYRLRFSDLPPDSFTLTITSTGGYYDFSKYGVPQIAMPSGYTASTHTTYNVRILNADDDAPRYYSYDYYAQHTNVQNSIINLLKTTYVYNGSTRQIVGDAIIEEYTTTITFIADDPSEQLWGSVGFYQWNTVLDPTEILREYIDNNSSLYVDLAEDVYVMGYESDGTLSTISVNGIYINEYDGWDMTHLEYNLAPDQTVLCYNFGTDTWQGATSSDDGIVLEEITAEQMRVLQFTDTVTNTIVNETYPDMVDIFLGFFEECTTYHETSPLYPDTFAVLEGRSVLDGGLYVHYYVDKNSAREWATITTLLYGQGYSDGYEDGTLSGGDGGAVDFTKWLVTSVGSFMSFEIIPDVLSIGGMLAITIGLALMIAFLKFFAGG